MPLHRPSRLLPTFGVTLCACAALAQPVPQPTPSGSYPIVDTGQSEYFGTTAQTIASPQNARDLFYGQDAQFTRTPAQYHDHSDGTVSDLNTGLMWVAARGAKVSWDQAMAGAAQSRVGGYSDWRMPTLKELYSLIDFRGQSGRSAATSKPYIDTRFFSIAFGDATGGRVIDAQDWSATRYVSTTMHGQATVFGVNFIDGRIKGYPLQSPRKGGPNTLYVRYVRGNPAYGVNQFQDHGDGTLSDRATGLMWAQADSRVGMNWQEALAWVQAKNLESHLGYKDWRLPNAKELHSIVDYSRSPDTTQSPALDPLFTSTSIENEAGATDYPFYWTSTTHLDNHGAVYIAFGRAPGWLRARQGRGLTLADVHGAGAQRSDPKAGTLSRYALGRTANGRTAYGLGPQGDVVRITNFVRLVRSMR